MRIAMWSGPRNLSTAMMYSFGARSDFAVWDEPFYAPYLSVSGAVHPMQEEVLDHHENDPEKVSIRCLGDIPESKPNFYMKHMPHHMLTGFPLDWANNVVNIHLIRHPARVIASYAAKRDYITMDDIGFRQQLDIYNRVGGHIVDSFDIRTNPEHALRSLCSAIGLDWDNAMLAWPKGGHRNDGVWAKHWYSAVHESTGFAGPESSLPVLDPKFRKLLDDAMPIYEKLQGLKLAL